MDAGTVVLLGDANIDTIMPMPEFPVPGRDGLATELAVEVGGAVVNTAIVLDRLGIQTRLISSTGQDVWAEHLSHRLADTSIDTRAVVQKQSATTGLTFIVATPDGERTMFSYRGANTHLEPGDIDTRLFEDASILHISGYALMCSPQKEAVRRSVEIAKERGIFISLDTGLEPVVQNPGNLRALLTSVSLFISGEQEVMRLMDCVSAQQAADRLLKAGARCVAIMMGRHGSLLADDQERMSFPVFPVQAVDSTGAGDSYAAGLLYSRLRGLSLAASGALASALGALAVTVYGAGFSLPDKKKVTHFLNEMRSSTSASAFQPYIDEVLSSFEGVINP